LERAVRVKRLRGFKFEEKQIQTPLTKISEELGL
jgi:hypothetical protein